MIYLLLIVPHLLALGGLLMFAIRTGATAPGEDGYGDHGGGGDWPPRRPGPPPGPNGLPLDGAVAPRRRLRVGERLAELHPRRGRRDHDVPRTPRRAPTGA